MHDFLYYDAIDKEEYCFGDKLDNRSVSASLDTLSTISYRYIDFDKTNYNFWQDCFDNQDIVEYFSFVNMLTTYPFNELLNKREPDWHLNSNDYNRDVKFRNLINTALDIKERLTPECTPLFYHFALYTNQTASRESQIKSPRIYFFIGANAVIYPLFYDPYHEINP